MSERFTELSDAFNRHIAGQADRGGVSPLDVLVANTAAADLDPGLWTQHVARLIRDGNPQQSGFWAGIRLILKKLELKSVNVTAVIETALVNGMENSDPFDAYEGWRCFVEAGGYLTIKRLHSLDRIRLQRAPLWLDLAILAHCSDSAGLGQALRALASEKLVTLRDLKPRLADLQHAFGQDRFISQMRQLAPQFQGEARKQFAGWIEDKLYIRLDHFDDDLPKTRKGNANPGQWANDVDNALDFAFESRVPQPLLAVA